MSKKHAGSLWLVGLVALLSLGGCADSQIPTALGAREGADADRAPNGVQLQVSPGSLTLPEYGTRQVISAEVRGPGGERVSSPAVTFTSQNPGIAVVDENGLVTALQEGETRIEVRFASLIQSVPVVVKAAKKPRAKLLVSPQPVVLGEVGQKRTLRVLAWSAQGKLEKDPAVTFQVLDARIATVNALGEVTARAPGATKARAVLGLLADTAEVRVLGPALAPTSGDRAIDVQLVRFDGRNGEVTLSSGIPLPPGWLQPSAIRGVSLIIGNQEQPVYVEALGGRHPDGSLRSVLLQTRYLLGGTPVSAKLYLGGPRQTTDLAKVAISGEPEAALLPTDPGYLISTDIVGPTTSVEQTRLLGGAFAEYETAFASHADAHWQSCRAQWDCNWGNYYDRALIYYAWWARTGNAEYWRRANAQAVNYRTDYLEPNGYGTSPHWSQLRGLERNYLLTGDEASRRAVVAVASGFSGWMDYIVGPEREGRIQARVLESFLLAWRLGDSSQNWAAKVDEATTLILGTQSPSGAYISPLTCDASLNFMSGLLNDVFIEIYRYYRADARIPAAIKRSADYLWANEWLASAQAFRYSGSDCEGQGKDPAPDLNMLMVDTYGFVYKQTGDASYRLKGDAIFANGVAGAYLDGGKQFNENYNVSYLYTALR
jgi:hypothetical protein